MSDVKPIPTPQTGKKKLSGGMQLLLDLGPLVLFFVANSQWGIFVATGVFMAAIFTAMGVSYALTRHVTGIQIFSAVLVGVMGGLTIYLQNETFIKMKPTILYSFAGILLAFGLFTGRNLLKSLLGSAFPGLDDQGWYLFTRNWVFFFAFKAILNEAIWRNTSTDFWIAFKMWFFIPVTFIFVFAHMPMLMRHGFNAEPETKE